MLRMFYRVTNNSTQDQGGQDVTTIVLQPVLEQSEQTDSLTLEKARAEGKRIGSVSIGGNISITLTNHPKAQEIVSKYPYKSEHDDLQDLMGLEINPVEQ